MPVMGIQMGIYLHSACADESHLRVLMLKDHPQLDWILKHQLNLDEFRVE